MNLHEFQAKELLSRFGVPVPRGRICDNGKDACRIAERLGFARFVVKAQVQAGDRMAAGGVRFSVSPSGVQATVEDLLGTPFTRAGGPVGGERVRWVLVEEALAPMQLVYAAVYLDPVNARLQLMASPVGGEAIERRIAADPGLLKCVPLTLADRTAEGDFDGLARSAGFSGEIAKSLSEVFSKIAKMAATLDATQVEINPLAILWDGRCVALDAKVRIDDSAMFRHPAFAAMSTATEIEEGDPVALGADRHHINYQRMDGEIGVVVNGAGLALATIDCLADSGGVPANFMDIRTTASSLDVAYGMELILANAGVRSILVNIHGGGMQRCDTIAEGLGIALRKAKRTPPLTIRFAGNNAEYGHTIMSNNGVVYQRAHDMGEAARMAVAASRPLA
ncbi:MAG: acetate--CoA ligase family protein [Hyphomicrobiaceae bacterium]|nr:acetate--CoA ligase family protein [Hyphomicrobiaceae bacterium]